MTMSATIARLAQGRFTVMRPSGSYVAGRWVEGAGSAFEIVASIQPATPKELQRLPEGDRVRDVIAIWTTTELQVAASPAAQADRVTYAGASYEVQAVERWDLGEYFKALASRVA
jgi:hypothetical protein